MFQQHDIRISKKTTVVGHTNIEFAAQLLNAFNHANLANPGNNISDAGTFGFITATTGVGERNIRLALRATF